MTKSSKKYSISLSKTGRFSKNSIVAVGLMLCLFLLVVPFFGDAGMMSFLIILFYYLSLSQMWNLLAGYVGLVSFGQQLFIGVGGYTLVVFAEKIGMTPWLSIPIAGIIGGIIAYAVGFISLRLKNNYFTVGTIAIAEIFRLSVGSSEYLGYAGGVFLKSLRGTSDTVFYYIGFLLFLISMFVIVAVLRSNFGLKLMAIRDNESAAESLGIDIQKSKMMAFIICSVVMTIIGCFIYMSQQFVQPDDAFSLNWSILISFMVIIGGIGTIEGPIIGTLIYVLLQQYFSHLGSISLIILGILSVLTMLYAPKGLFGFIADKYDIDLFFTRRLLPVHKPIKKSEA